MPAADPANSSALPPRTRRHAAVLLIVATAVLSACGGGGDEPAGTAGVPAASGGEPALPLTVETARALAAEALQLHVSGAGVLSLPRRAAATAAGTQACPDGGTLTVTTSFATGASPQPGDTLQQVATDCAEAGEVVNGTVQLRVASIEPHASGAISVLDLTLQGLDRSRAGVTNRLQGPVRERLDTTGAAGRMSVVQLTSAGFSAERITGGRSRALRTVSGLNQTTLLPIDASPITQTTAFDAEGRFGVLGETSLHVQTLEALTIELLASEPSSGKLRVTAAGGGVVTLTLMPDSVLLELDADGDGRAESTEIRTRQEFAADLGD